uniref:Uncharacterized protein n=1 Tax=Timema monikensis TaxID=170555 RepID=A0A7R9HSY5_9NEOP|nr:unnamed protein product [Timema monikensis]
MIAKLQGRSPLKQKAVRGLSSLDPCAIQHSPQLGQKRFSFLLEEPNHANIINDVLAENAKKEYSIFATSKNLSFKKYFVRLLMKSYAFVRSNVPKTMAFKTHTDSKEECAPCPEFSCFLYYLFAPTLVYRDNYPR